MLNSVKMSETGTSSSNSTDSSSDSESDSSVASNTSQLSFEFTDENCQERIDEFVQVTNTNSALAQFFLQDRKWNVVRSVNDYFKQMRKKEKQKRRFFVLARNDSSSEDADDEDEKEPSPSNKKVKLNTISAQTQDSASVSKVEGEHSTQANENKQKIFRHITWNVDGANVKNLKIRIQAICNFIIKEKASLIFLQEVTEESENIIQNTLSDKFTIISGDENISSYYTLTLISKKPSIKVEKTEILHFKQSLMGRNIIKTNVSIDNTKFCLLNTHLESTKEGQSNRIQQLSYLLNHFKAIDKDTTVIAGGDLNLRDKELASFGGLPPGIEDAWIASGRRKEVEFTWDMMRNDNLPYYDPSSKSRFKPRMRFDRVFVRKSFPVYVDIVHFGLIGIERLKPHVCFPSDHWGVITSFQIFRT